MLEGDRVRVEVVVLDGTDVITVTGEIDIATVKSFDAALAGLTGQDLVVDLRGVSFMDSTGLHSLLRVRKRVEENGGEVRLLLGEPGHLRRLLYAAGVLDQFLIEEGEKSDRSERWSQRLARNRPRRTRQGKHVGGADP